MSSSAAFSWLGANIEPKVDSTISNALSGTNTPDLEQAGNVIDHRHLAPSTHGSNRRVAGAGRHIEHGLTAAQIDGLRRASRLRSESLRQLSDSRPPPTLGAVLFHVAHRHVSLQNCAAF
jgi:hypothetical protein